MLFYKTKLEIKKTFLPLFNAFLATKCKKKQMRSNGLLIFLQKEKIHVKAF